jgi:hypothetical protein
MASRVVFVGSKKITLTDSDYIAQGGQGVVYKHGNQAIKIAHDASQVIPEAKILELAVLTENNILGPREVVKDSNGIVIGYAMPYASDTEFLTRLFNLGFKKKFGLDPSGVLVLVKQMQDTLNIIHKKEIIVGDYNPNNFLVAKTKDVVYHIDVDNYQTKRFKCMAIMDSVRDWSVKSGHFDEKTDWFSWSIVAFQLYTGIHPFMGSHPDFADNDLKARILGNTSVFNSATKIPKAFSDFSMIPKAHLDYFKKVFETGFRDIAPLADGTNLATSWVKNIAKSSGKITITTEQTFDSNIQYVVYIASVRYVVTENNIYRNSRSIANLKNKVLLLAQDNNDDPVIGVLNNKTLNIVSLQGTQIGEVLLEEFIYLDGRIYFTNSSGAINLLSIKVFNNNPNIMVRRIGNCMSTLIKAYNGLFIQELYGKKTLKICSQTGVHSIDVPELDGLTVADSYYRNHWCVLTTISKSGSIYKHIFKFDSSFEKYEYLVANTSTTELNSFVTPNKMLMSLNQDGTSLMLFGDLKGNAMTLDGLSLGDFVFSDSLDKPLLTDGSELISIKMT